MFTVYVTRLPIMFWVQDLSRNKYLRRVSCVNHGCNLQLRPCRYLHKHYAVQQCEVSQASLYLRQVRGEINTGGRAKNCIQALLRGKVSWPGNTPRGEPNPLPTCHKGEALAERCGGASDSRPNGHAGAIVQYFLYCV